MAASPLKSDAHLLNSSQPQQSETSQEVKCDVCAEQKIDSLAKEWCVDCREYLCVTCKGYHKRYKTGHNIIDLQQLEAEPQILSPLNFHTRAALISSIYILEEEDDRIFVCEWKCDHYAITEYMAENVVASCKLEMNGRSFFPDDISFISHDTLVVACSWNKKLCYMERRRGDAPTLEFVKVIRTKNEYCSLSYSNNHIYACDKYFQVDLLTKKGDRLRTLKTPQLDLWRFVTYIFGLSWSPFQFSYYHRIRVDPSTQTIWMLDKNKKRIFCFNNEGDFLKSVEGTNQEEIEDICVSGNGLLYYCSRSGVFSLAPLKLLYRFQKPSECDPRIYVLKNKVFVSVKIDSELFIKCICIENI